MCVGNVVRKPDRRGNHYPAKQRPEQKTDAAVVLVDGKPAGVITRQDLLTHLS